MVTFFGFVAENTIVTATIAIIPQKPVADLMSMFDFNMIE